MREAIDDHTANLPGEAFVSLEPVEVERSWLRSASPGEQKEAMEAWWHDRFEDPAASTPYNGAEGGYMFIHGGPFDPADRLPAEFSGDVPDDVIDELVQELHGEVGDRWAPIQYHPDEDYGYDVEPHERAEPAIRLGASMVGVDRLVELAENQPADSGILYRHAFIALIAALETYLWETAKYWVTNNDQVLRNVVTKSPKFKDQEMRLGQIFERYESLNETVNEALKQMLWHRLGDVKALMKHGLEINLPSVRELETKIAIRHHLVHRNGRDLSGQIVFLARAHIERLKRQLLEFCAQIEAELIDKWPDEAAALAAQGLRSRLDAMGTAGSEEPPTYEPF